MPVTPPIVIDDNSEEENIIGILSKFGVDVKALETRVDELKDVANLMEIAGVDVSEIYSPPRVIKLAREYGLNRELLWIYSLAMKLAIHGILAHLSNVQKRSPWCGYSGRCYS